MANSLSVDVGPLLAGYMGRRHMYGAGKSLGAFTPDRIDTANALLGLVLAPAIVNGVNKIGTATSPTWESDRIGDYVKGGAFAVTGLAHWLLLGGRSSFLFGAFLGQIPTAADALANLIVKVVKEAKEKGEVSVMPEKAMVGIGDLTAEDLKRLQMLQGTNEMGSAITDQTVTSRGQSLGSSLTDYISHGTRR